MNDTAAPTSRLFVFTGHFAASRAVVCSTWTDAVAEATRLTSRTPRVHIAVQPAHATRDDQHETIACVERTRHGVRLVATTTAADRDVHTWSPTPDVDTLPGPMRTEFGGQVPRRPNLEQMDRCARWYEWG
jgi:hypothetical protein